MKQADKTIIIERLKHVSEETLAKNIITGNTKKVKKLVFNEINKRSKQ